MSKKNNPAVGILMGSASDRPVVEKAWKALEELGVPYEVLVASAHRSPARVMKYATEARKRGVKVVIAAAGGAAHLAGVIAAHTTLPVIGIPVASSPLAGFDSLLSTVQMPPGVPVATVGVGESGATNAGLLAAAIIAVGDPALAKKLDAFRAAQEKKVGQMNDAVQEFLKKK